MSKANGNSAGPLSNSEIEKLQSEVKIKTLLYSLATNFNLQLNSEGLLDSIGRLLIRETEFYAYHWHWVRGDHLIASKNWIFRKTDLAPTATEKINLLDGKSASELDQSLSKQSIPKTIVLHKDFHPYNHVVLLPIFAETEKVAVVQLFSESPENIKNENSQLFLESLQKEIGRQYELGKLQERERDQVVQLAQASRLSSLGAMAGGIAHEINNPLTIIMGMLKLTLKDLAGDKPIDREKISGVLEKARQYTERIGKIVKGVRALSRDGSRDPFILSKIQDIVDSTFALCEAAIKTNSIQLSYDLEDPEMMIQCRPVQISQVILNLINNSMDAIGDQTSPWIHIGVRKLNETMVEFSVTDSGPGIPEAVAIRLMQPFFTTKGSGKGTGLGLSISQEIIKVHSGNISLDKNHQNTRFVFQIPIEQNNQVLVAS